jgi:16S rRNA processing protein RimM
MATQPNPQNPDAGSDDVAIGRLHKPRGFQGEVFCQPLTDFVERFAELETVTAILQGGLREELRVENARLYGSRLAIKFKGIDTPEAATILRNAHLVVPQDETFNLPENTFYIYEVVGMVVETEQGETVGLVTDVLSIPGNDVYVVDRSGEEVLIPAVRELITVDREARKIVVQSLEGLV